MRDSDAIGNIILMFFQSCKGMFDKQPLNYGSSEKKALKVDLNLSTFIKKVQSFGELCYPVDHIFLTNYLHKFVRQENPQFVKNLHEFNKKLKQQRFCEDDLKTCLHFWLNEEESPLVLMINLWSSYVQFQIELEQKVHCFLVQAVYTFSQMIICLMKEFYPQLQNKKKELEFQFRLLNRISKNGLFKQVMMIYHARYDQNKGSAGEFTPAQTQETFMQMEQLINFSQIAEPFSKSISLIKLFYEEHEIKEKIKWLIRCLEQAKKEISEYRKEFKMKDMVMGADQMLPVINYICEKTGKNILASTSYIDAFLGHNARRKELLLRQVSIEAEYCLSMVASAAALYCHVSQFI